MRNPEREAFKELHKAGKAELTEDEFFEAVSREANHLDPELIRSVYFGMIKAMAREIRNKRIVKLPGLGHFLMVPRVKKVVGVQGGRVIPAHHVLHFRPVDALREYLRRVVS